MRNLLLTRIAGILSPSVVERLPIDSPRVLRQVIPNRSWQIVVSKIGHTNGPDLPQELLVDTQAVGAVRHGFEPQTLQVFEVPQLIDSKISRKSSKALKAGIWYKEFLAHRAGWPEIEVVLPQSGSVATRPLWG